MKTPKSEVQELINRLPDGVSFEDIQYPISVLRRIEQGLRDVEQGRTVSQREAEARLSKWIEEGGEETGHSDERSRGEHDA